VIDKIDVRQIVSDHLRTLRTPGEDGLSLEDLVVFFGLPLAAGLLYVFFSGPPPEGNKIDEVLVASFSVFAALLLNIQVFLLGFQLPQVDREADPEMGREDAALLKRQEANRKTFYRELFSNISYAILLAMVIVFITLVSIFCQLDQSKAVKLMQFVLILHFTLTLLMVMKRVHVLFVAIRGRD
jgi:hypothetical protein